MQILILNDFLYQNQHFFQGYPQNAHLAAGLQCLYWETAHFPSISYHSQSMARTSPSDIEGIFQLGILDIMFKANPELYMM